MTCAGSRLMCSASTDAEIRTGLAASGASDRQIVCWANALEQRIAQLQSIAKWVGWSEGGEFQKRESDGEERSRCQRHTQMVLVRVRLRA